MRKRAASPASVAIVVALLSAAMVLFATGGDASSLSALKTVAYAPSPAFLAASEEMRAGASHTVWGAPAEEEKGLPEKDDPEYTKAIDADYEKVKEKDLGYYVYKVLHYIHVGHVGLEYTEIGVHQVQHSRAVVQNMARAVAAYKHNVVALRAVFANYAAAFETANTYIAVRKSVAGLDDAAALAKIRAAAPHATKTEALAFSIAEARQWISSNMAKVRSSGAYLARYAAAIRQIKLAWFTAMRPALDAMRAGTKGLPSVRVAQITAKINSGRAVAANSGYTVVRNTVQFLARLTRAGSRFAVAALSTVVSHKFIQGVLYIGVAFEMVHGVMNSKATTTGGLIVDGVIKGGIGYLIMSNPAVALLDLVLPKALRISSLLKGMGDMVVGTLELVFTGDSKMLEAVHKASLSGEYGLIMNAASAMGEALAGDWSHIQALNEKNLSGKNGAVIHLASGMGALVFNGNFKPLEKYHEMALSGEHGTIARVLAESGEFWAQHGLHGGLREVLDSVVSGSKWFGRPEDQAIVVYKMPTKKGIYLKIRKCTTGATRQADRPKWSCMPKYVSRSERRLSTTKHTNVGFKRDDNQVHWDYNADPSKSGYGLFWKRVTSTRTVQCTLGDSVRLWPDSHFHGTQLRVFAPLANTGKFNDVAVLKDGRKIGTCEVLINVHQ